jgi:hypothetical protein
MQIISTMITLACRLQRVEHDFTREAPIRIKSQAMIMPQQVGNATAGG